MGSERLREVDALRSFALGGILMVNIWYFADPFTRAGELSPNPRLSECCAATEHCLPSV